jgi:hypothetical protein
VGLGHVEKSELNDKFSDVQIMEFRPKYENKPMPTSSIKCESIDSLEAHTGCDCNDRRKRVKNMNRIMGDIHVLQYK